MSSDKSLILIIGPNNTAQNRIDFSELNLNRAVSIGLKRALKAEMGHNQPDTQKKGFKALKVLAEYLAHQGQAHVRMLPIDVVQGFTSWIDSTDRGPSAQSILKTVCRLLAWCQRNVGDIISKKSTIKTTAIRDTNNPKRVAAKPDLKLVLAACYRQIEKIEERLEVGRRLISGQTFNDDEKNTSELIQSLLALGKGILPKQYLVNRSGNSYARRIEEIGGHRALARLIYLCPEDLFPFFTAVVAQTSGNPDAIKMLSRNSIHPHPLRSDLERIQWIKKRGAREQFADFPCGREWSAPSILRRLMRLTAPLLSSFKCQHADKVFLSYCPSGRSVKMFSKKTLLDELSKFTTRNGFSPFQFRDLRHAGARAHHVAGESILAAKKRLNHSSVDSTIRYTTLEDRSYEHESVIRKFQGELVQLSMGKSVDKEVKSHVRESDPQKADTLFGFTCKDPLAGMHPRSPKGKTCLQFAGCATCPGAIITVDDPIVVARLLATSTALEETKKRAIREGWLPRFEMLYEETRHILITEILPAVHSSVQAAALSIDMQRFIPVLE